MKEKKLKVKKSIVVNDETPKKIHKKSSVSPGNHNDEIPVHIDEMSDDELFQELNLKISYVLPVRNEQNNIANSMRSILGQMMYGDDLIIIDDCSTDNTRNIIEGVLDNSPEMKKEPKPLVVLKYNEERMGAAWCRNVGNRVATGDIIAVCDAEVYYQERGKAIREFFNLYPEKSVFYSSLHLRMANDKNAQYLQEAYVWDFKSKCNISHPTVAYKRELALRCPYHEDSKDTDLFEFCLLDMHKTGAIFGGCANPLMLKIEGNTNRDMTASRELKKEKYRYHGIEI